MVSRLDLAERAAALTAAGTPFVWATVVRAERPTSAKAGDSALVLTDGEIDGFVGGECAEATVRAQSLEVLAAGETRVLRITPNPVTERDEDEGVVAVHNACLSGGTLDIFLEPTTPMPVVAVYGHAPIAMALQRVDRVAGFSIRTLQSAAEPFPPGTAAVVVASHGNDEDAVLTAAVRAEIPYVGLVASRARGPSVVDSLELDETERKRIHTPAGLDIGGRTPPEVALSILAEIVALRREQAPQLAAAAVPAAPVPTALDPVCGMTVAAVESSLHVDGPKARVYFCGTGCRTAYLDNPAGYA